MKNKYAYCLGTIASLCVVVGCATKQVAKDVDQKIINEVPVEKSAELVTEATISVETMPGLTDAQRNQLLALRDSTHSRLEANREQSLKIRSLLIQEMLTKDYNKAEVAQLKKRFKKNEEQRVSTVFQTIDKANEILGRNNLEKRRDIREMELREQLLKNIL